MPTESKGNATIHGGDTGENYEITENGQGTLLTYGQDSILLYGVHDFDL